MGAVWMWLRSEGRARWRVWLGLAIVLGAVTGASIAAGAGARRTESAYPRFVRSRHSFDVELGGFVNEDDPAFAARVRKEIISLPQVADYDRGPSFNVSDRMILRPSGRTISFPEIFIGGEADTYTLRHFNTPKIVKGRMFRFDATDEAVTEFTAADRLGLHIGQRLDIVLTDQRTGADVLRPVRLVGIVATPGALPAVGQVAIAGVNVSPGFVRANESLLQPNNDAPSVRLKHGAADIPAFIRGVNALHAGVDIPLTLPKHLAGVRRTLAFDVTALWLLAAVIGVASLAIVGQALGRQATLDAGDFATLRAIGLNRRQLFGVGMARAAVIGIVGGLVAFAVAVLASPIFPRGLTRVIEPSPGIAADWTAIGSGIAATIAIALFASVLPAWRATRAGSTPAVDRTSGIARRAARAGAAPSIEAGLRLALEPGTGRRAVPVRSTIMGIAIAFAAFWGAASFTQSLNHLVHTPSLQGYRWDAILQGPSEQSVATALHGDPDVVAAEPGGFVNSIIDGEHLIPFAYTARSVEPAIVDGRAPRTSDEIALGARFLRLHHHAIGDTIEVALDNDDPSYPRPGPQRFRIVGTTVVPSIFFQGVEPGHGAALTMEGAFRLDPGARERRSEEGLPYVIRYRHGVDVHAKLAALRKKLGFIFVFQLQQSRADLDGISRSSGLPYTMTEILLFLGAATLVHALVSAVRKRRHDLAILKTLGFSRRQIRSAVAWQASVFIILALAIGLPLGTVLGHWMWQWFVASIGLIRFTITPPPYVVAEVVIEALILANLIAFLPGRSAARTKPALVLRTE